MAKKSLKSISLRIAEKTRGDKVQAEETAL
jgi:hypothetical protein